MGKYTNENQIAALKLFIIARNEAIASGFEDNGGAIHSVERILDYLAIRLKYGLSHVNNYKKLPQATCSIAAHKARSLGDYGQIRIEHVHPQRAFARAIIKLIDAEASDDDLINYIKTHYQLVLLTREEASALDRKNRSVITADRLGENGIQLFIPDIPD